MTRKIGLILLVFQFFCLNLQAQETLKMMFYNLLNFPNTGPFDRIDDLEFILQDYQPDLFMVCELNDEAGANLILTTMQGIKSDYERAQFVFNTSDDAGGDQNDLQNLIFYDSSKFILESQEEITTVVRDFNHYRLRLNTIDQATDPVILHAIVCHLKASTGPDNQNLRLQMVNDLVAYLETLPGDELVLLGGDLNLYTQNEPAFQELVDPTNNITFTDPANRVGTWSNNLVFLDVFTQSTRTGSGDGGAGGGFDDRFDFIMTSESLITNPDLFYVPGSYQAFGNNGNLDCYNQAINSSDCDGPIFDSVMREALHNMSDHLPVTLELQLNDNFLNIEEFASAEAIYFPQGNVIYDILEVGFRTNLTNLNSISIYNSFGQKVLHKKIGNLNLLELDLSYLSSGLYYLSLDGITASSLKFIKK